MRGLILNKLDLKVDVVHGRIIDGSVLIDDFRFIHLIVISLDDGRVLAQPPLIVLDRLGVLDGIGVGKDPTSKRLLRLVPELGLLSGILGKLFLRVLVVPIGAPFFWGASIFGRTQMLSHLLTVDLNHRIVGICL
jgi:hypothetical protein